MTRDPVKELEDQIRLFRTELSEVKRQQLTKSEFKAFQSSLEATAQQVAGVQQSAADGAHQGASRLLNATHLATQTLEHKINKAVSGLSEAQGALLEGVLARRRNVGLLMAFSALTGALLGGLVCRARGGVIFEQTDGTFCVFERD